MKYECMTVVTRLSSLFVLADPLQGTLLAPVYPDIQAHPVQNRVKCMWIQQFQYFTTVQHTVMCSGILYPPDMPPIPVTFGPCMPSPGIPGGPAGPVWPMEPCRPQKHFWSNLKRITFCFKKLSLFLGPFRKTKIHEFHHWTYLQTQI